MIRCSGLYAAATIAGALSTGVFAQEDDAQADQRFEEVTVWGVSLSSSDAGYTNPTSVLLPRDMLSINAATTEDLVKYEPSLVIRRRFIGDSNGTLGLRGSNMFQTSRSMVFADGVPLHYLLQSRWNGAPRWTMVSASEIEKVEVLYGPFSAEYSGNAMGGVVLIETGIPQEREFHADITTFVQEFDEYAYDDTVHGYKGFVSYGNKVGGLSYYLSYNRLDNDSQPQTFRGNRATASNDAPNVTGGVSGLDARLRNGEERTLIFYGDTGVVNTVTNNYKLKMGYEWENWQSLLNVALEDRSSETRGNSYIRDLSGNPIWRGEDLVVDGYSFSFDSRRLNETLRERESLSVGLRIKGKLSESARLEMNLNQFDILTDEDFASQTNPSDPGFTLAGEIEEFDNSGWQTGEVKLNVDDFTLDNLTLIAGLRHENYELNLNQYDSPNYRQGIKGNITSRFGGKTRTNAAFIQANWDISDRWDLGLGLRYEDFKSSDGYYSEQTADDVNVIFAPSVKENKTSPKFSLGYKADASWLYRYSLAKAYRFPIVEELFSQYRSFNSINESNPELAPEEGLHHNVMIEKSLEDGYARVNIFQETIENAIESQTTTTDSGQSVRTFVPLDEVHAAGVEFVFNKYDVIENVDLRFNLTFTEAEIRKNAVNRSIEGNTYPRMPKWRSNILATYHLNDAWNIGANMQYASDSFGRIENDDTIDNVYGAQDAYTRLGLKTNYTLDSNINVSFGVDNLTNEIAYVAHPWPGRTFYLSVGYEL